MESWYHTLLHPSILFLNNEDRIELENKELEKEIKELEEKVVKMEKKKEIIKKNKQLKKRKRELEETIFEGQNKKRKQTNSYSPSAPLFDGNWENEFEGKY